MGLLRSSNDDKNCSHHHWSDYEESWDSVHTRVQQDSVVEGDNTVRTARIEIPKVRHCEHEGCDARDYNDFSNIYQIPLVALCSGGRVAELEELIEAAYTDDGELTAGARGLID